MGPPLPVALVLEQTLGHVTHTANLTELAPAAAADRGLEVTIVPIPFEPGRWARVPGWSNWTVRAAVRTRRALRRRRGHPPTAMFVHTQVLATLLGRHHFRIPTIVSLDATPQQYDELGEFYQHTPGPAQVERLKHRLHVRALQRARRVVAWSDWTRDDLIARYGVAADRIDVIPPGVDVARWRTERPTDPTGPLEVLFVGGDLQRKGGDLLLAAASRLRERDDIPEFVVHLVTGATIDAPPGVTVHRGLTPNSPELIARFRSADVFALPTYGDCLPLVLAEAGAAGLPLIATDVGAIREIVVPGSTGELIPTGDVDALAAALARLLGDAELRRTYGANARRLVERAHDAQANAARVMDLLAALATPGS